MPDEKTVPDAAETATGSPPRPADAPAPTASPAGAEADAAVVPARAAPAELAAPAAAEVESEPVAPSARPAVEAERVVPETVEPAVPAAARPLVRRHHWIVRLTHWANTVVLVGMMASGLQIYNAYERFGIRGTRLPLPNPFDMHPLPRWARLGGWLAGGLSWHFFLMWPLALNGLLYVGYLALTGEWRPLLFRPRDLKPAIEMQKYYLHLRKEHPPQGKHNALQKGAYSFIVVLGMLSVLTGLSLWKPVQLSWLTALFGGYELARYWHFVAVWLFAAFIVVHVILVFAVDPASLRAMITGWYRGRFPSHD
jgi:thiosulfate reductase cytochrome b subunit